jgi:hypothetical protein
LKHFNRHYGNIEIDRNKRVTVDEETVFVSEMSADDRLRARLEEEADNHVLTQETERTDTQLAIKPIGTCDVNINRPGETSTNLYKMKDLTGKFLIFFPAYFL